MISFYGIISMLMLFFFCIAATLYQSDTINFAKIFQLKLYPTKTPSTTYSESDSNTFNQIERIEDIDQCTNSIFELKQEISLLKQRILTISAAKSAKIPDDLQREFVGKMTTIKADASKRYNALEQTITNSDKKLAQFESSTEQTLELIRNELKTIKHQQQQNTKTISLQINQDEQLKKKISLLEQQMETVTISEWNDFQRSFIEKYSNLEAKIRNIELQKLEKRMKIWDIFMSQQNEMNDRLLKLLESQNENEVTGDRADFAVRVVYHTEIMTSSAIESATRKLYYFLTQNYDQNAVQITGRSGDCTALKQHNDGDVYIIFKLRESIYIEGITIEYIKPTLLHNNIDSAPKNMSLELSNDGYHYYNVLSENNYYLMYNPLMDGVNKYFQFQSKTKDKYQFVKLNIISNYGAEYSCMYRVQIHGNTQ